jgi:hypothetical protein
VVIVEHLFASVVRVERMGLTQVDGVATMDWSPVDGGEYVRCRLDLNFLRPGKDIAPAPVAGKAPDRIGLMFCSSDAPIRAGDRVVAIPGDDGTVPVSGTFEIRVIPDLAMGFSAPHHMEIQILETNQDLDEDIWPSEDPL